MPTTLFSGLFQDLGTLQGLCCLLKYCAYVSYLRADAACGLCGGS